MRIGGLQKSSLIDYPDLISCIIFTQGCNFRCGYCHNPELLDPKDWAESIPVSTVLDFLKSRVGKLDALVVTRGEPTLHHDLLDFLSKVKAFGFKVKLDTNGTNPDMLGEGLEKRLIDYVAMDIKAPLHKYSFIANRDVLIANIRRSIDLIMQKAADYEFRTTVVEDQLTYEDAMLIGKMLKGAKKYYLQKFIPSKTNSPEFLDRGTYSDEILDEMKKDLLDFVDFVDVR